MDHPSVSWRDAEPTVLARELTEVAKVAPDLVWDEEYGTWAGELPLWPFERVEPAGLHEFVDGRRFRVLIEYPESYPMVEATVIPLDPAPTAWEHSATQFHVLPSGGLCLFRDAVAWEGTETAAELVLKAAGWFLEYLLIKAGLREEMTPAGIADDDSLDELFERRPAASDG